MPWSGSVPLRIATANTRAVPAMRQAAVRRCFALLRARVNPDLAALQEMFLARYYRAFANTFRNRGWHWHLPWGPAGVGVLYRDQRFRYLSKGKRRLHGAIPGVSSARTLRFVTLDDKTHPTRRIAFASAHPTPSAWSSRLNNRPALKRRTQDAWREAVEVMVKWLEDATRNDYVAVLALDANASHAELCKHLPTSIGGEPVHVLTSPDGWKIDHIILIGEWTIKATGTTKTPSDHAIFYVDAEPPA